MVLDLAACSHEAAVVLISQPKMCVFLSQVTMLHVTTPSTVPPSFTVTVVGNYTKGNSVLTVATNESANVNYLVMLGRATAMPTAAQVRAVTNPTRVKTHHGL